MYQENQDPLKNQEKSSLSTNFKGSDLQEAVSSDDIKRMLKETLTFYMAERPETATNTIWLHAVTLLARGLVFKKFNKQKILEKTNPTKFVNYISMEFLIGKLLKDYLHSSGIYNQTLEALDSFGIDIEKIIEIEPEPGLGNGGLGRLAACFLDSLATLNVPAFGYGIRYNYGMFTQKISEDGSQVEVPDMWLLNGYLWEIYHPEVKYLVPMYYKGDKNDYKQSKTKYNIYAVAYDVLIPGYKSKVISRLRLWSAVTSEELVLDLFNVGDYARAFFEKNNAENISSVLYPDDRSDKGKELRLQQEYFFSSASIQDIVFRFKQNCDNFNDFSKNEAIHLNDTHPSLAIPEFIRVLTDNYHISWDDAWAICQQTFSYTNHTLLSEALEIWEIKHFKKFLPHILDIIYQINQYFLDSIRQKNNYDLDFIRNISLIEEGSTKRIRMANLCVVSSKKVNGVSKLHTQLMKDTIFKDFYRIQPEKFVSITNGVTPRRWLMHANRGLSRIISQKIGEEWKQDFSKLEQLKNWAEDFEFQSEFAKVKRDNKAKLAEHIAKSFNTEVNCDSLFDIQIKRIHEYKRQLLNLFYIIHRYNRILAEPDFNWTPRTFIIGGKAASAYYMAKLIIRLINNVADVINNDKRTSHLLKLFFLPNYSVKLAELIVPAADISEQISTAGFEASGTGNMKLSLNGALTIGTSDGANIEIMEKVGEDNFFLFGKTIEEIKNTRHDYDPLHCYENDLAIKTIIQQIRRGLFSKGDGTKYIDIINSLLASDSYMVLNDFPAYVLAQTKVDQTYQQPNVWWKKAILNTASMWSFSSDETIKNYLNQVWDIG